MRNKKLDDAAILQHMRYVLLVLALFAAGCGASPAAPVPLPPPAPTCQTQSTATVYFQNRTTANLTYDIVWDGSRITTVAPGRDSAVYTFAANVPHALRFQFTNTTVLACNASTPTLATCSNNFYSCTG